MDPVIPQPQEPQYQTPVPEHKHFLNKKFVITFVVLLLLGGGAYAGIWMWQNQQMVQEVVPTFTPRADAMAGWKTYTYKNISVRYPSNWRDVSDNQHAEPGGFKLSFVKNAGVIPVEEINQLDINSYASNKNMYTPNIKVFTYKSNSSYDYIQFTENNIPVYASCGYSSQDTVNACNQILSTFKFTDSIDTSTWKTYTNTQYGFELKYPSDWRVAGPGTFVGFGPVSIPEDTLFGVFNTLKVPSLGIDPANPNHEITKIEDAYINGLPAKRIYDRNISANQVSTELYITHGNTIIAVGQPTLNNSDYPFSHSYNTIINQILSTFKFTDSIDTSTWKTYTNTQYGFEMKYPASWTYQDTGYVEFFPPNQSIDLKNEYHGDITLSVLSNPNHLDFKTYYGKSQGGSIFDQSEKQTSLTINSYQAEKFIGVYGMVPSDVISISKGSIIIELTDVGQNNTENGIFDAMAGSVK